MPGNSCEGIKKWNLYGLDLRLDHYPFLWTNQNSEMYEREVQTFEAKWISRWKVLSCHAILYSIEWD